MPQTTSRTTRPSAALDERQLRRRLEALVGIPATEGNALTVLRNGDEIFPAMLDAVAAAQRSVDFCTFVYWRGDIAHDFAHALGDRAQVGVRVRVLLDAFGGRTIQPELLRHMRDCGVDVRWFRQLRTTGLVRPGKQNHRGHRKVLVCDEHVAFTGGVGIAEEWCGDARHPGEWRDTHFRVEGPAVDGVRAAFTQNWAESGGELVGACDEFEGQPQPGSSVVQVVRGSATPGWGDISTVFRIALETAQERVRLETAYFNPDEQFRELLVETAARGVEVSVLLPGPHHDKRVCQLATEAVYADLVARGVAIWNFQPTMLHAKVMTVDRSTAVVGSSNFNRRSLELDEELVLTVFDDEVVSVLDEHFEDDLARSERISPTRWSHRPIGQRIAERVSSVGRRWF